MPNYGVYDCYFSNNTWTITNPYNDVTDLYKCKVQKTVEYQEYTVTDFNPKTYYKIKSVYDLSEDQITKINVIYLG